MPVSKVKNGIDYDIVIKSLRRREVSCLVVATPPSLKVQKKRPRKSSRNYESELECRTANNNTNCRSKRLSRGNIMSTTVPQLLNKKAKSLDAPAIDSTPTIETKKRSYRRKISCPVVASPLSLKTPKKIPIKSSQDHESESECQTAVINGNSHQKRPYRRNIMSTTVPQLLNKKAKSLDAPAIDSTPTIETKKRSYRSKNVVSAATEQEQEPSGSSESASLWMDDNARGPAIPCRSTPSRKIPPVPFNTPVGLHDYRDNQSTSTSSDVYSTASEMMAQTASPMPDDESTCTGSTESWFSASSGGTQGHVRRRGRRTLWPEFSPEDETNITEYEMNVRRNIEENRKILQLMFAESGVKIENKLDTPRSRRAYNKVPLPPPRPKSARLEVRKPLDFSMLAEKLAFI